MSATRTRDAAWTITTELKYASGPTAAVAGDLAHLRSATATDDNTLVLQYAQPVANALQNPTVRANRLNLLNQIRAATHEVADFSRIEG